MAMRTLLCVEPDDAAVDAIREAFSPYGFEIKSIANGEEAIEWAKGHPPTLIIVSVEPRKVGYAICNKIKRSNEVKDIPLVLTSAEETPQTFEQHKKLKSHANEYILKPFKKDELLAKVDLLVTLGQPTVAAASEDVLLGGDFSEEISIADGDIVEENSRAAPVALPPPPAKKMRGAPVEADDGLTPPARPFPGGPELDAIFDQETDAAFAALQAADTGNVGNADAAAHSAAAVAAAPSPWDEAPAGWEDEKTRTSSYEEAVPMAAAASAPEAPAEATPEPARPTDLAALPFDMPPSPDEVSGALNLAFAEAVPTRQTPVGLPEDRFRSADLQDRIHDLESERRALVQEIEDLKARLQTQPTSKEKDILTLREIINRKEKDVLDLRDSLDAKERLILDHKDRIRENERARRDLEEKSLGFEKTLMGATERLTALTQDKEKSIEREKGLKGRLDDALMEIQKAHGEADGLKKRLTQAEERARGELDRMRGEMESRITELEEGHRGQITKLNDERASGEAALVKEHEAEVTRMTGQHDIDLEAVQRRANEELLAQTERAATELNKLRKDNEKALASLKEEQSVQVAAERQAHQGSADAKERDHKNEVLGLRRRQEEELASADERRQRELTELQERQAAELDAADVRRRTELQARDEQHNVVITEMDRRHFTEKTETSERFRVELDQAHVRAARAEGELAARTEELSEAHRRVGALGAELDTIRADLRDREVKLAQGRDRTTELESKVAEYEDQILRAFQRLRADEKAIEKAKRALAVALSLLEDRAPVAAATTGGATARASTDEGTT